VLLEREASRHPDDAAINERLSQVYMNLDQSYAAEKCYSGVGSSAPVYCNRGSDVCPRSART
jgi:hypothetical protein